MTVGAQIGTVLDGATPHEFPFKVVRGFSLPLHEYVTVEVGGRTILAEAVSVGARNPLARDRIAESGVEGLEVFGYEVAVAECLGYVEGGKVMRPKHAPRPSTPVYLADDGMLQEFYRGESERLPVRIGTLIHRKNVTVPVHLQDLSFHLGIFAQTRGGKSYLAGKLMEEILRGTQFPVVAIDVHGDYVMMDRSSDGGSRHGEFNVFVYYPPGAPRVSGVTAEVRTLGISPRQMTNEALMELLGHLGPLQSVELRRILKELRGGGKPFGLREVISRIEERLDGEGLRGDEKRRLTSILARLEDAEEETQLQAEETSVQELLRPKTLSVICLRGLRSRVQEAYAGIVVDLIFRNQVRHFGDLRRAPPAFVFVEEAHRVASADGGRYAAKIISTAVREGAKFGLFMCLISQRPRSIDPDIMANIGNYAVLRITNAQDQSMIESASESFSHRLVQDLPALNQGEAVLVGPFVTLPAIVRVAGRGTAHHGATPNLASMNRIISGLVEEAGAERW
jgi:DNA helicase HerA-like ATPase